MRKSDAAITKCALVSIVTCITLLGVAQAFASPGPVIHQYFPLHVGDRWVYVRTDVRGINPTPQDPYAMEEVRTTGSYRFEGRTVFRMENYTFGLASLDLDFFRDQVGRITELALQEAGIWYRWEPEGSPIELPAFGSDCVHGSQGFAFGLAAVTAPVGTYDECLVIEYRATPCLEIGLVREVFAPGLGLIERTVRTTTGLQTWSLKYASINGYEFGGPVINPVPAGDPSDAGNVVMPVAPTTWGAIKSAYAR